MVENYKNESMIDVAFSVLTQADKILKFNELYDLVCEKIELTDEEKLDRISEFYTNLSLDGRFVTLGDTDWDLRSHQTYDKVHIDMNDVYSDMDEETKGNTDLEEYDQDEIEAEGLKENEGEDDDDSDYDTSSNEDM